MWEEGLLGRASLDSCFSTKKPQGPLDSELTRAPAISKSYRVLYLSVFCIKLGWFYAVFAGSCRIWKTFRNSSFGRLKNRFGKMYFLGKSSKHKQKKNIKKTWQFLRNEAWSNTLQLSSRSKGACPLATVKPWIGTARRRHLRLGKQRVRRSLFFLILDKERIDRIMIYHSFSSSIGSYLCWTDWEED